MSEEVRNRIKAGDQVSAEVEVQDRDGMCTAWPRISPCSPKPPSYPCQVPIGSMKIPMVDLPLGATDDRVCGTIDIEKALTEGVKAFEPGLLAKANRGILYVDEVNLLDDHLVSPCIGGINVNGLVKSPPTNHQPTPQVDVLLDSAASGWNTVEREGISISHPARVILVGSGELVVVFFRRKLDTPS
jgi:hypothetical protein